MAETTRGYSRISVLPFEVKELSLEERTFWAIASTPQLDRAREVVATEAMMESASRYLANPLITWQHDAATPIGKAMAVEIRDGATWLQVYLTDKTEAGRNAWGLVQDGIVKSMSIGFNPYSRSHGPHPDGTPDYEVSGDVLTWKRIDWLETAVVSIPCNPGATIPFAKGLGLDMELPVAALTDEEKQLAEERRFADDLTRGRAALTGAVNIARHWRKERRLLSDEHVATMRQLARDLSDVTEPYPSPAAAPEAEDADPCVLRLPERLRLATPPA
jgi:HK97 family phage prohead protease